MEVHQLRPRIGWWLCLDRLQRVTASVVSAVSRQEWMDESRWSQRTGNAVRQHRFSQFHFD